MSKKYATTVQNTIYVVEYFKLIKDFTVKRKPVLYAFRNAQESDNMIHSGSYERLWQFEVNKKAELNSFLRRWYPKSRSVGFYTHLNYAIKANQIFNYILIIRPLEKEEVQYHSYILKPKKMKNPHLKKKRKYYCDCFLCVGTEKDRYHHKKMKEEKLLFKE
jgi:hypothetical protein